MPEPPPASPHSEAAAPLDAMTDLGAQSTELGEAIATAQAAGNPTEGPDTSDRPEESGPPQDETEDEADGKAAPTPTPEFVDPVGRSSTTSLLTWGTVALVLVIVIVLVVLKITGSSPSTTSTSTPAPQPAPASVIASVTKIPAAVYNAVGVTSPDETVAAPTSLHGQPALKIDGKPEFLFVGSEFCPYCAAERWSVVAALSRFGKFELLPAAQSAADEAFPGTPTFSFAGAKYKSPYVAARLVEMYSDQKNSAGTSYRSLSNLTSSEKAVLDHYDRPTGTGVTVPPFVDVDNQAVIAGGSFSPAAFEQLTMSQVATGLTDPKDPTTQAIVAGANYLSAAICAADGNQPANVCSSRGVQTATTAAAPNP